LQNNCKIKNFYTYVTTTSTVPEYTPGVWFAPTAKLPKSFTILLPELSRTSVGLAPSVAEPLLKATSLSDIAAPGPVNAETEAIAREKLWFAVPAITNSPAEEPPINVTPFVAEEAWFAPITTEPAVVEAVNLPKSIGLDETCKFASTKAADPTDSEAVAPFAWAIAEGVAAAITATKDILIVLDFDIYNI